jgi:hypothetical protein
MNLGALRMGHAASILVAASACHINARGTFNHYLSTPDADRRARRRRNSRAIITGSANHHSGPAMASAHGVGSIKIKYSSEIGKSTIHKGK